MSKFKPRTVKTNSSIIVLPAGIEPTLLRCCNTPLTTELGRYSVVDLLQVPIFPLYCDKTKMKPGKIGSILI